MPTNPQFTAPQFGTVLNQEQLNQWTNITIEPATHNIDALQAVFIQEVPQQQAVIQPQEVSDFVQRYKDTWVKASWEGKEPIVVLITGTVTKGKSLVCALRGDESYTPPLDKFVIQKSLPSSKFVNLSGGILYGSRVPERQWKRGVCKNTYLIRDPITAQLSRLWGTLDAEKTKYDFIGLDMINALRRGATTTSFWQPTILDQFFDPVYPSYLDCWKQLKEGKAFAVAFHPQYCLSLSLDEENFVIIRRNSTIAVVDKTNPTNVTPIDPIFKQELIDLSKKYLINVMVN